jgi:SM-20-related protein
MGAEFEKLIAGFIAHSVGIVDHFLPVGLCEDLASNILNLQKAALLRPAGLGNDTLAVQNQTIRKDKIHWLDKKHNDPFENAFLLKMDAFVTYLNATCYTNIQSYEFHYSLYEKGDFYRKHLDQFKDNASRQYSMISYLNPAWQSQDGGELLIYPPTGHQKISPTQGKTVFFKSSVLEHEVLVTTNPRMSITGWLKKG